MKKYIILTVETIVIFGLLCMAVFLPSTPNKVLNLVINITFNYLLGNDYSIDVDLDPTSTMKKNDYTFLDVYLFFDLCQYSNIKLY